MTLGERVAREAERLVGTPFRLQGRDPETGVDCIGLVAISLQRAQCTPRIATPMNYRLRNSCIGEYLAFAELAGLVSCTAPIIRGDIIHTIPGPAQDHLLVAAGSDCFIHAHAGLRRVVIGSGLLDDPVLHHWRPISD